MKITINNLKEMKQKGEKIVMLTAYDYPMASLLNQAGIEVILVGDSLGMVVLGYESTLPVTIDDIIYHTKAVKRANINSLLVSDLPFMSYQVSIEEAVKNAGRVIKEGGAQAVKIEGGREIISVVKRLVEIGIPVMGHLGLTPQSINKFGGYKLQGKNQKEAEKIKEDAKLLEESGCFALILECVPESLAQEITANLSIPTIGIGAGRYCDGQVLVINDILGFSAENFLPKYVKKYANLNEEIKQVVEKFKEEVKNKVYPDEQHIYK